MNRYANLLASRSQGAAESHVSRLFLGAALLSLLISLPLHAAEIQQLFNGKNLEGWTGDPQIWSVEDGQIVGSTVDHPIKINTFLVWQSGEVDDFRLTFKARLEGDNNSGVQYRSELVDPKTWRVFGPQMDMHANPAYTGMLYSEGTDRGIVAERGQTVVVEAGAEKPTVTKQADDVKPIDVSKWHTYSIIAKGNHLIHKVDGKVTVDVTDNHKKRRERGCLALQVHAGPPMTVYFKDFKLETDKQSGK